MNQHSSFFTSFAQNPKGSVVSNPLSFSPWFDQLSDLKDTFEFTSIIKRVGEGSRHECEKKRYGSIEW